MLTRKEVEAEPYRIWNAYVDLLARELYEDLTHEQRAAHLVFWYESEVQNGGHLQYFENRGVEHLAETIDALSLLGANCQQQILHEAAGVWRSRERERITTAQKYSEVAGEGEFDAFDSRFYACTLTLQHCLQVHLERHQASFVVIA